ncbi:MAG: alpha/beta hydrolase [Acidobacteriaceae bacterium]
MDEAYGPIKPSRTVNCEVRGLEYSVRIWGEDSDPAFMLLHGVRDSSPTFQFLVDALRRSWRIVAPDWRGHGGTQSAYQAQWFHDYLADLEVLVQRFFPEGPMSLVGHSLGGNVASVYAGLRPEKIKRLVSIDGFGMIPVKPADFRDLLSLWIDARRKSRPKRYTSVAEMADKLVVANHRLSREKALFLAGSMSRPLDGGGFTWQFDLVDRRSTPTIRSIEEWAACWRQISAETLWIAASDPRPGTVASDPQVFSRVVGQIGKGSLVRLTDTGHNVHHDAPGALAAIIEPFLRGEQLD